LAPEAISGCVTTRLEFGHRRVKTLKGSSPVAARCYAGKVST
jgi:hypothetical protein